jgi:crotonobetainyl-CoA:carnitine CoA-transferase CaiB-like acyl-CoA transferase
VRESSEEQAGARTAKAYFVTREANSGSVLAGIRVIDASNLLAGPIAGMVLADFGADVIKIEEPGRGDPLRSHGEAKDGEPLWWKLVGRNKRAITLDLSSAPGQEILRRLVADADVLLESFRPGVFESWGLSYERLAATNPSLVMVHVSAFGRSGPMRDLPGFGTLAESMSGFAYRNGDRSGPPVLPPFGLGDNVTGLTAGLGAVLALFERVRSGKGQEVDVSIIHSLFAILEPQLLEYDQLGTVMTRIGSSSQMNAPRNLYRTSEGSWLAISASTQETANRMLTLVGRPELLDEPWFHSARGRAAHADVLDQAVASWVAQRTSAEVLKMCTEAGAPVARVMNVEDIANDPQFDAIGAIAEAPDPALGRVRMPSAAVGLSRSPARIRWAGPGLGSSTDDVLAELGYTPEQIGELRRNGTI